ncbi:hypothetical protein [Bacillus sp. MUM 13]|uniref:hypothetical protein n=1 Tax=Bacillus sp. MUM 13 TaxID=1678001 RepID=UPI00147B84B7|nr:hypothetical protein [Bacillus sp. MUM 13]
MKTFLKKMLVTQIVFASILTVSFVSNKDKNGVTFQADEEHPGLSLPYSNFTL